MSLKQDQSQQNSSSIVVSLDSISKLSFSLYWLNCPDSTSASPELGLGLGLYWPLSASHGWLGLRFSLVLLCRRRLSLFSTRILSPSSFDSHQPNPGASVKSIKISCNLSVQFRKYQPSAYLCRASISPVPPLQWTPHCRGCTPPVSLQLPEKQTRIQHQHNKCDM